MYEYTKLDELQGTYSDMFKDVYGFRPRWASEEQWNSEEWLQAEINCLAVELKKEIEREKAREQEAIYEFESTVTEIIRCGAIDRKTALRWLFDAEQDEYKRNDKDYYCFCYGLPYGYFKNEVII